MKKKFLSVLSLSALATTAVSLSGCGITDEELFNQNAKYVFLSNEGPAGAGVNYNVVGTLKSYTAFTQEFIDKGGKVVWTSNNSDVIDVTEFNGGTGTTPINNPDFGSPVAEVKITATVTMGSYTEDVVWNLLVEPKTIENETLDAIISKFYARLGDETNNPQNSVVKKDSNDKTIVAMFVLVETERRAAVGALVSSDMTEYVSCYTPGRAVNITATTSADIINAAIPDIKATLDSTLSVTDSSGNKSNKSIYECLKEVATSKTIGGVALSESDYNAVESLGVIDVYNNIATVMADSNYETLTLA